MRASNLARPQKWFILVLGGYRQNENSIEVLVLDIGVINLALGGHLVDVHRKHILELR
jgi:hypothetical protein